MLQVASDPTVHAHTHSPGHARPSQRPDRAPSPFESLLDSDTPAALPPSQPSADDKSARVENGHQQRPLDSSGDNKTVPAGDKQLAARPDAAPPGKAKNDDQAASEDAAGLNGEIFECVVTDSDVIKPAHNGKSADAEKKIDDPVAAPATDNMQTVIAADAIGAVPTPGPESKKEGPSPELPEQAAPAAQIATQLKPVDPELLKAVVGKQAGAQKQGDADKKADVGEQIDAGQTADGILDEGLAAKANPPAHANAKPQSAQGDGDKQLIAQARGEGSSPGGRADVPPGLAADANAGTPKGIAEASQPPIPSSQVHAVSNAAPPATIAPQPGAQPVAVPLAGLAVEIAGKALAGKNRFEIRLDPPELGRIEVRLDVDRDGNVTSRLTVDRAETYDLLRRDAAGLERALQDAGLKTTDNGLQFSLRDQSSQRQTGGSSDSAQVLVQDDTQPAIDVIPQNYGRLAGQGGGLDIRV